MIEANVELVEDAVTQTQTSMLAASRLVLGGFELRSDFEIVRYPDRYEDERGATFFREMMTRLERLQTQPVNAGQR